MPQPERRIVDAILMWLRGIGAFAEKNHGAPGTRIGTPDIYACVRGRFVAFEVKTPRGAPTPAQLRVLAEIEIAGGYGAVVTSVEGAQSALEEWGI